MYFFVILDNWIWIIGFLMLCCFWLCLEDLLKDRRNDRYGVNQPLENQSELVFGTVRRLNFADENLEHHLQQTNYHAGLNDNVAIQLPTPPPTYEAPPAYHTLWFTSAKNTQTIL